MSENRKKLEQLAEEIAKVTSSTIYDFSSDKYSGAIGVIDSDNPYNVPVYKDGKLIGYYLFSEKIFKETDIMITTKKDLINILSEYPDDYNVKINSYWEDDIIKDSDICDIASKDNTIFITPTIMNPEVSYTEERLQDYAIEIMDSVENLLRDHNVIIYDRDNRDNIQEGHTIMGMEYFGLEDSIIEILRKLVEK